MHSLIVTGLALLGAAPTVAPPPAAPPSAYTPNRLTPAAATEDVTLLRRALAEIHPGYGRYTSVAAMDAMLDALALQASGGSTDIELYCAVSSILAHVRCDHTKAELPPALETFRRETPSYLPFTFRLFGGRMYVDRADPEQAVPARGDEVLSINGRPVGAVLETIAPYVPVDGWTDHARRVELEHSSEFLGDAVDHFWPLLYGWPERWEVAVRRRGTGDVARFTLAPLTYGEWSELATGNVDRWSDNFGDSVAFRMLDATTGYLSVGTFVNYRNPVDPAEVFDPVFDELRDAGAQHLILDLRQCGGGSDDVPAALTTYLTDTLVPGAKRPAWVRTYDVGDLRPHLSTWDDSVFETPGDFFEDLGNGFYRLRQPVGETRPAPPRANRFDGRVTILTSPANASGATIFVALAREHDPDVRVVGEPTGGSAEGPTAGIMFFLTLPNSKIKVRVPALRSWVNVAHPAPGRGVEPDLLVVPTVEDWLARRDPVLEAARAFGD